IAADSRQARRARARRPRRPRATRSAPRSYCAGAWPTPGRPRRCRTPRSRLRRKWLQAHVQSRYRSRARCRVHQRDPPGDVLGKVADWLSAGTRLVWVVDPERRLVRIYRANGVDEIVSLEQALNGEDVVPGFACQLATIL